MGKQLIKERSAVNSKGQEIYWRIFINSENKTKPYTLVQPGSFDRHYKTLKSAEKAWAVGR